MWWLHTVEIHLVIAAFSLGAAFGMALVSFFTWRNK